MEDEGEVQGIVIVGGGICGLATALALHRKGIHSLVLEKSETLRAYGAALGVHANGWRALDQLGVAAELREMASLITEYRNVWQHQNKTTLVPVRQELRCLKRKDLIETLAKSLPPGAIRFGCRIAAIAEGSGGLGAVLTTVDGGTISAMVVIGCDGSNSVVAKYLGLKAASEIPRTFFRGLTRYPHGHTFGGEFLRLRGKDFFLGRLPITDNLVHFAVSRSTDATRDVEAMRERVLENLRECPTEITEMVRNSDAESLHVVTNVWYVPPWRVMMLASFRRGTVTIAGDAMHAMGPFIGQGGSAGLEDAVVLARSLSPAVTDGMSVTSDRRELHKKMSAALGEYLRERRPRVVRLCLESFIMGALQTAKSTWRKLLCMAILTLLGTESLRHTEYDCGRL